MKHLLTILAIFAACIAGAQTPITTADQPIQIGRQSLGCDTIDQILLCKSADFEALILNRRTKSISTQWKISFKSNGDVGLPIKPLVVELQTDASQYNDSLTGNPLGSLDQALALYGYRDMVVNGSDTTYQWRTNEQGQFLTSRKVMDGWSYYMATIFDTNARLKQVLRQTLLKPANLAIIQQRVKAHLAAQGL